jgi:predicted MFS family arabinose efflux permease
LQVAGRNLVVGLLAFLTVVDLFAAQAILPSLAHVYGVGPAATSLAVNACTLGMAGAALAVSFLAARIDRRRGIVASMSVLALLTLLLAGAPDLKSFAAIRIGQGLCMATAFSLSLGYLADEYGSASSGGAIAAYVAGNVASNLIGRLIAAVAADQLGVATTFQAFALLNLLGAALAAVVVQRMGPAGPATGGGAARSAVRAHLHDRRLRAAFAVGFCILFAFIGTFTYVSFVLAGPPFFLSAMQLGIVCLVFLPSLVTTPLAASVVARLGTSSALRLSLSLAVLGVLLLLSRQLTVVLAGLALVGVGTFLAQAIATGFVGRNAIADRAAASGLYLACYFTGGLAGSAVLGALFDTIGWAACVAGIGAALLAATALARRMSDAPERTSRQRSPIEQVELQPVSPTRADAACGPENRDLAFENDAALVRRDAPGYAVGDPPA